MMNNPLETMRIDRRTALKFLAAGGLAVGLPGILHAGQKKEFPDLVAITGDDPSANVRQAIAHLGGITRFVSKGDVVLIKPNLYFVQPAEFGTTTDPKIIRVLCKMALEAGAKRVNVVDLTFRRTILRNDFLGIKGILADLHDTYLSFVNQDSSYRQVEIPCGVMLRSTGVLIEALDADVIINVPVAKSHSSTRVTFGLKNVMGLVEDPASWHKELDLEQAIADFATFLQPQLTVLDATRGLLTGGPGWPGKVGNLRTVVVGTDSVAVDSYALTLSTWHSKIYTPKDVRHIQRAANLGVGTIDLSSLNIVEKSI